MVYQFRKGSRFPVKAQVAGEALARVRDLNDGRLEAVNVVEVSRPVTAPLHGCFEWDDTVAAERHRENQARQLIRCIEVIPESLDPDVKAEPILGYVLVVNPVEGRAYEDTQSALSDPDKRRQVVADALALLDGVRQRYRHLTELQEVFAAIDRTKAEHEQFRARHQTAEAKIGKKARPKDRAKAPVH